MKIEKDSIFKEIQTITKKEELDLITGITDEFGVIYSKDGKRLIKIPENFQGVYTVKEGTEIICDWAICDIDNIEEIILPNSLKYVGERNFAYLAPIKTLCIPKSVIWIGDCSFSGKKSEYYPKGSIFRIGYTTLLHISTDGVNFSFKDGLLIDNIHKRLISNLGFQKFIRIPDSIEYICPLAFEVNKNIQELEFPKQLKFIGECAFSGCRNLKEIKFKCNEKDTSKLVIKDGCFNNCTSLSKIEVPLDTIEMFIKLLPDCKNLLKGV